MRTLILYSSINEPITKALFSKRHLLFFEHEFLSLKQLLNEVEIRDILDVEKTTLSWAPPEGMPFLSSETALINNVISLPLSLFDNFSLEDRYYAYAEFRAYLTFALSSFAFSTALPGAYGLAGNLYPLPLQWEMMSKKGFFTPDYYLGNPHYCPFINNKNLIYSTPFNFFNWKADPSKKSDFSFLRPKGQPVIITKVFNEIKSYSALEPEKGLLSLEKTSMLADAICEVFNYNIFESVIFVDGENITFGVVINTPFQSQKNEWFNDAVIKQFNKKFA